MKILNKVIIVILTVSMIVPFAVGCTNTVEKADDTSKNKEVSNLNTDESDDPESSQSEIKPEEYHFEEYSASIEEKQNNEYKYWLHKRDDYFKREAFVEIIEYLGSSTEVKVPSAIDGVPVRKIGNGKESHKSAFPKNIKSVNLPDTVYVIGDYAFYDTEIETINIPETAYKIEDYAFCNCFGIKNLKLPSAISFMGVHALERTCITEVVLTELTEKIPDYCFYGCENLKKVVIGDKIEEIGEHAFGKNKALTQIDIPDTIKFISEGAFENCSLGSLKLPENIKLGEKAFSGNLFTELTIPKGVEAYSNKTKPDGYEEGQFSECKNLKKVTVNSESVYHEMFYQCENLTEVYLSDNVKKIFSWAFSGYYLQSNREGKDVKIHIPQSVQEIEEFDKGGLSYYYVIYGKKGSEAEAFANKYNIKFVEE